MNKNLIGKFITKKREEMNCTQEVLAEKLGVSSKKIISWENGKRIPSYSKAKMICKELNITMVELMDGEEQEKSIRCITNEELKDIYNEKNIRCNNTRIIINSIYCFIGIISLIIYLMFKNKLSDFFKSFFMALGITLIICSVIALTYFISRKVNYND